MYKFSNCSADYLQLIGPLKIGRLDCRILIAHGLRLRTPKVFSGLSQRGGDMTKVCKPMSFACIVTQLTPQSQ